MRSGAPGPGGTTNATTALTPFVVGQADNADLGYSRVAQQDSLDDRWTHVHTAADDDVFSPVGDDDATVALDATEIARPQPTIRGECSPRRHLVIEVAVHEHAASDQDLAIVGDLEVDTGQRMAVVGAAAARFGQAVGGCRRPARLDAAVE